MRSSGSAVDGTARRCLIVDGYNVLGRMEGQAPAAMTDLGAARDRLISRLAEYGAVSGVQVVVVFDAHRTDSAAVEQICSGVRVIYTAKGETADERVERLVYELRDTYDEITVATSDAAEQQVAFGGGALRIPAGELARRLRESGEWVRDRAEALRPLAGNRLRDALRHDVAKILEKWRRQ
ncbi:MAG: NYN domain-containing protein [Alicyclobacillus sp.]|nr:NYN domain-containing protein [Alicyclobacillus sp.]